MGSRASRVCECVCACATAPRWVLEERAKCARLRKGAGGATAACASAARHLSTGHRTRAPGGAAAPDLVLGLGLGRLKGARQDRDLHISQLLGHLGEHVCLCLRVRARARGSMHLFPHGSRGTPPPFPGAQPTPLNAPRGTHTHDADLGVAEVLVNHDALHQARVLHLAAHLPLNLRGA